MDLLREEKRKTAGGAFSVRKTKPVRLNYNYKCGSFQLIQIVLYADPKEKIHEMMEF